MRFQTFARVSVCCTLVAAWATIVAAAVKLPAVIGDNMVLAARPARAYLGLGRQG